MYQVGIDIGSSAAKTAVIKDGEVIKTYLLNTGFSSRKTAEDIYRMREKDGIHKDNAAYVATGYGRISVPYADKSVTEITCHGKGAWKLFGKDGVVIDIGGQDTKGIVLKNGRVMKFVMNDKCSAGTGKFLEVMTNGLGLTMEELSDLASRGNPISISSMCTVFAESEVISLIGRGESRENIAFAVIDSIVQKVVSQAARLTNGQEECICLTGGLCDYSYLKKSLGESLKTDVLTDTDGRYAGAIGAALSATTI